MPATLRELDRVSTILASGLGLGLALSADWKALDVDVVFFCSSVV